MNLWNIKNAHQLNLKANSFLEVEPSAEFGPATITLPRRLDENDLEKFDNG